MDDRVHVCAGSPERGGVGDVALDELGTPCREPGGAPAVSHERPHGDVAHAQRVHDVRPDEARAARDENGHSADSKFL